MRDDAIAGLAVNGDPVDDKRLGYFGSLAAVMLAPILSDANDGDLAVSNEAFPQHEAPLQPM